MEPAKMQCGTRKVKKKHVKDELDRMKQAEKKRRRLEKALATSAAIRSELEKKKEKKQEELKRLEEEGAAISEAVALNVLLGEDSDDSCKSMFNTNDRFELWDCTSKFGELFMGGSNLFLPHQDLSGHSFQGIGRSCNDRRPGRIWNNCGDNGWRVSSEPFPKDDCHLSYFSEQDWEAAAISPGAVAAAVASLQIAEDAHVDTFMFNRMLRG